MFYPDCGFGILKMASPNLVLFKISLSTFSLLLSPPFLFSQHTQSLTFLTLGKLFHSGSKSSPCSCPAASGGPLTTAMLCFTPGFQQPLVSAVSGVLPSLLLVWCLCNPAPSLISSCFPRQNCLKMKTLPSELIFHSSPKQFTVKSSLPCWKCITTELESYSWKEGRGWGSVGTTINNPWVIGVVFQLCAEGTAYFLWSFPLSWSNAEHSLMCFLVLSFPLLCFVLFDCFRSLWFGLKTIFWGVGRVGPWQNINNEIRVEKNS